MELRRAGEDVVDLGFGNPDLPSPEIAVAKLQEAAAKAHNHRYSASPGSSSTHMRWTNPSFAPIVVTTWDSGSSSTPKRRR